MAAFVLRDASIVINSVDLSNRCTKVEIKSKRNMEDNTTMGATGLGRLPGLRDEGITATFKQDLAAAEVDQTLTPLYENGTAFTIVIKASSAAVSTTNPKWTATCYLEQYNPIGGDVGSVAETDVQFTVDGVWVRATS